MTTPAESSASDAMPPNRMVLAAAKRAQQAYDLSLPGRPAPDLTVAAPEWDSLDVTGELRAALDLYVQALEADDGISIEGARATSKAWHRCSLLGATREDMTAAHERVGR